MTILGKIKDGQIQPIFDPEH